MKQIVDNETEGYISCVRGFTGNNVGEADVTLPFDYFKRFYFNLWQMNNMRLCLILYYPIAVFLKNDTQDMPLIAGSRHLHRQHQPRLTSKSLYSRSYISAQFHWKVGCSIFGSTEFFRMLVHYNSVNLYIDNASWNECRMFGSLPLLRCYKCWGSLEYLRIVDILYAFYKENLLIWVVFNSKFGPHFHSCVK